MGFTGLSEYIFTIGIIVAFVGTIVAVFLGRRQFGEVLKGSGIRKRHLILAVVIAAVFLSAELAIVKPTQLLFFDDAIYQGGALDLLHMGQAWMCDYGTPLVCYTGEIFHEPVGTSFMLAMGYALFGVHLSVVYDTMLVVTLIGVLMAFLVGSVLFENPVAGLFAGLIVGLSPVVLIWAVPTTSDIPMFAVSLVAIFMMLVFVKRKSVYTLLAVLLSLALVTYTKVDALLYVPVILLMFLVLDKNGIRKNFKLFKRNFMEPAFLAVILIFAVTIMPEGIYSYSQLTTGDYGAQGTNIPYSCSASVGYIITNTTIGLQNIGANICANALFWLDTYEGQFAPQPLIYTGLAIVGVGALLFRKRKELAALAIWFGSFFMLYAAFYAGSVLYGVDWRFMLALIAPVSILGGYAASLSFIGKRLQSRKRSRKIIKWAAYAFIVAIIFYPLYALSPILDVQPSSIQQAGDARFYEGFVFNNSKLIPSQCLVFSYDPTLFMINNRTSAQLSDLYPQAYQSYKEQYNCLVVDWGYWCYTPNDICTYVQNTFTLNSIINATYVPFNRTYAFYYVTGLANQTNSTG